MGAAWCRNRAQAAQDSKSPLDRVIVRCVNQVYPPERPTAPPDDARSADHDVTSPKPRPAAGPPVRVTSTEWEEVSLQVPDQERTPLPPPRKKRQHPARRKNGVSRPPPPQPPSSEHLLSPDKPRHKNISTVSLPNFSDLRDERDKPPAKKKSSCSLLQTPSGPSRAPSLSSVSEATAERVESYMRRCRSFGTMPADQLLDKLNQSAGSASDSEDSWAGLDDWDLGVIEHCPQHDGSPPLSPTSKLQHRPRRKHHTKASNLPPQTNNDLPFLDNSKEDDWFQDHWSTQQNGSIPTTEQNGVKEESELSNVKKELQSIIYDYNRCKKVSTSSMEVLPTQPVRIAKKKISVTSVTPPPSPEATDSEESIPLSAVINGETNADDSSHSTLLRILKAYQAIEDEIEDDSPLDRQLHGELPGVHSGLAKREEKPTKETEGNAHPSTSKTDGKPEPLKLLTDDTQKVHNKIDSKATADTNSDAETQVNSEIVPVNQPLLMSAVNEAHKLLQELDNKLENEKLPALANSEVQSGGSKVDGTSENSKLVQQAGTHAEEEKLLKLEVSGDSATALGSRGSSSRSSMTPSLSELEAALSDMLEKSAEDEEVAHQTAPAGKAPAANSFPKPVPKISVSSEPFTTDTTVFQDNHLSSHPIGGSAVRQAGEVH